MMPYSFAMLTDLYQLTMAQGYWKLGKHEQPAIFDLFFREAPFDGGYALFCGLESILDLIANFKFTEQDVQYFSQLKAKDGTSLFDLTFLKALLALRLTVNIDAIKEGTVVFAREPLLRVEGPLWECQLLETVLLNLINFPTLIATKTARICYAAKKDPVMEFGLRRAQGPDGGFTASRAAYIGGAEATSNVLASQYFGIPVAGTHAHSWVMAFQDEISAFEAYAEVMPHHCILLVDTYNTLTGIKNAITVGLKLKASGHSLLGIRLDSGDLASLSIKARHLLDEAGLTDTDIIGSGDLDEYAILNLKARNAKISRWGVGTHLVTAFDQPALGGVYKLVAIKDEKKRWQIKSKQTDDIYKRTVPGIYKIRRFSDKRYFVGDRMIALDLNGNITNQASSIPQGIDFEDLLIPMVRQGKLIYKSPALSDIRAFAKMQLAKLPPELKELKPTIQYSVLFEDFN